MSMLAAIAMATAATAPAATAPQAANTRRSSPTTARASARVTRGERFDFSNPQQRNSQRVQVRRDKDGRVRIDFR